MGGETMTIETIIALVVAVGGLITGLWTARSAATKAELESLRKTIESLVSENTRIAARLKALEDENVSLCEQIDQLKKENERLELDNRALRRRLADLEKGKGCD